VASPDSTNLIINDINKSSDTAYKDIILELLHLNAPFYINNILRDPVGYKIDIFIRYDNKSTFTSPCCRIDNCKIHSKNPRVWRTLDTLNYKTFIHLDVPKIKCPKCGKLCYYEV
jgi:hypothetical protein